MTSVVSRLATPLRVHHIWDAISQNGPNQVIDFEKLGSVLASMHKLAKDEMNHELNFAIKDGLIVSEAVETKKGEETEIYKLPDVSSIAKTDHDWYCFHCHLGGNDPVVKCEDCPRIYHLDCLSKDSKPDKDLFVCPACSLMASKPSAERVAIKPKVLNQLLLYICDRFKTWNVEFLEKADGKSWAAAANRSQKDAWRYQFLVHMPMDLQTMSTKATQGKYTSLEEFQIDCETLVHALGVYFGTDMVKGGQIGHAFLRDAHHDIQEVKLCHDCFRRSNEKNHDWWFCLPCTNPHDVVWAKQTGYPYWPAKVMKKDGNKYDVRYFGGNYERGIIDAKNIQPIETSIAQLKVRRTQLWNDAYDELQKFQEIAKDPSAAESLPPKGKGASSATKAKSTAKRGASSTPDDVVLKKRKSEPASTPKTSRKSATASKKTTPQTNGTATPASSKKKGVGNAAKTTSKSTATPTPKESGSSASNDTDTKPDKVSLDAKGKKQVYSDLSDSKLDPEVIAFLNEFDDNESLDGDAYFSDEESNESHERVSEDAVSSSCNESKATRSVYIQVSHQGLVREKLIKKFTELQSRHTTEISQNKKKQWCYNCEREAIYHCCWNTAYCSIECQQVHWTREHKRLCRRKKPV